MMIFGIDVRREICERYRAWMDIIDMRSTLEQLSRDKKNEDIKHLLEDAHVLMNKIEEAKRDDLHLVVDKFEKDFANEVLENPEWYKN